ncbi:MarR family transcriptional regulator [Actinomycetospora sp. NBRC 106375]|uniref:MarR family winged helix-turn-helix transcriptional regulator n=1 Tax=Actinomycetospora sp. NBRC 106375 TaxID=3032207 RepID=UPI0024A18639|nr:MarR family transcriptional regulator [Actinomycetospora sp. NBRC 106375]GLZ50147.1 MarR family transcriptional regulator [Actinomycetospora sp. NBRC 106375]
MSASTESDLRPSPDPDDPGVQAWSLVLRAHAALVPVIGREVERGAGVPLSWYDILLELNAAPERRLRMQELGARVVLSRSRISRLVDDMAADGLVRRDPDPQDRRSFFAVMTDDGRAALRRAAPVYLGAIRRHFADHVRPEELVALRDALTSVLAPHERG